MSKKDKIPLTQMDFQLGYGGIIPSTQQAFGPNNEFSGNVRKTESEATIRFKKAIGSQIEADIGELKQFPSDNMFFVFIIQYFVSDKDFRTRDLDNMAKTLLDMLKGKFYKDDGQVKTLLVGKKIEKRVPKNFVYFALKEMKDDRDIDALKISGLERSVAVFNEQVANGLC